MFVLVVEVEWSAGRWPEVREPGGCEVAGAATRRYWTPVHKRSWASANWPPFRCAPPCGSTSRGPSPTDRAFRVEECRPPTAPPHLW